MGVCLEFTCPGILVGRIYSLHIVNPIGLCDVGRWAGVYISGHTEIWRYGQVYRLVQSLYIGTSLQSSQDLSVMWECEF